MVSEPLFVPLLRQHVLLVLILVLLEDGIGVRQEKGIGRRGGVLILVLLEDGIGVHTSLYSIMAVLSLNPCFIGRWYRRKP